MSNNNYIMINGKRINLTDEQIRRMTEQPILRRIYNDAKVC